MNEQPSTTAKRHVLLVNLGRGNLQLEPPHYEVTTYVMPDGRQLTSRVAGLALWWWLRETGQEPQSVLFACTDAAWEDKRDAVQHEALRLGLPWDRVKDVHHEVPRSEGQLWATLPKLESWLRESGAAPNAPVVLHMDLSHAFRAIPMAHSWLALYLQRRGMAELGVWGYGAFDQNQKDLTPYLDLSHFAALADWAEAVRAFRERLDTVAVARLLEPLERAVRRQLAQSGTLSPDYIRAVVSAAKEAGPFLRSGLPLEVGISIRQKLGKITEEEVGRTAPGDLQPFVPLVRELAARLNRFSPASVRRKDPKGQLALHQAEVTRQRDLVEAWLDAGMVDAALRAMRELVVNRVLLAWGKQGEWLQREARTLAEGRLNGLAASPPPRHLSPAEHDLRSLWREVRNRRNPFAHGGMGPETVNVGEAADSLRRRLLPMFDALNRDLDVWRLAGIPERREGDEV